MTAQEIFDKVLFSLRKQGKASTKYGRCMYRGPDGLKCAVGHLIEDADYRPAWEGRSVHDLLVTGAAPEHLYGNGELLSRLQHAHDSYLADQGLAARETRMKEIAGNFSLVYKEPTHD